MEFTTPLRASDNISHQKTRIQKFFKTVGYFTYCIWDSPEQWRLFIDASKTSLKAVLLYNGNKLPSIPVAYAPSTKKTYATMNNILVEADQWEVCGDFKVIAVLLGLQAGYTKYSFPVWVG